MIAISKECNHNGYLINFLDGLERLGTKTRTNRSPEEFNASLQEVHRILETEIEKNRADYTSSPLRYASNTSHTSAPYVLYKDGIERSQAQWGAQDPYSTPQQPQQQQQQQQQPQQQQQQTTSGAGSPQQTCGPSVPLGVEADAVPPRDQSLPSPAPSPYPATQAEPREDDIPTEQPTMDLEPRPASQCFPTDIQQQQQPYQQYRAPPPAAPPPVPPHMLGADVSPHLVFKNGINPTLWPQDVPFPTEDGKEEVTSTYGDGDATSQNERGGCFSPNSVTGNIQYPAYFKDNKGMNHSVFGSTANFGALQYLNKGTSKLPDVIQHGRSAGMPLYVRCPICQKEFKQKSTLLQHGCIHIESRPYPCPECGKRFRQQSHLTQHLRIHTNEKPYGCVYCGRNFRQRTILNQHLRIHTGEKPYKCTQCGKDFRQKAILDQHTRTHQGDRPFCCPMPNCRRRFATEPEVKKHIDNHMNPHAAKNRRDSTSSDSKHANGMLPRGLTPTTVVKPELYFPQCYAPSFNPPTSVGQFPSATPEFKPPNGLPAQ